MVLPAELVAEGLGRGTLGSRLRCCVGSLCQGTGASRNPAALPRGVVLRHTMLPFPIPLSESDELSENWEIYDLADFTDAERFWQKLEARDLLRRLLSTERYIIERCIMDRTSETEVATELGISQQTVSRWKRQALEKLR